MPNEAACKKFGRKTVRVKVIQLGDGTRASTKQADRAVKEDVTKEVNKQAVGNAATEEDWAKARAQCIGLTPVRTQRRAHPFSAVMGTALRAFATTGS